MKGRELMVETVAGLVRDAIVASEEVEYDHDFYEADHARAILNAILPQVTTVAELDALPIGSVVLDRLGAAWEIQSGDWPASEADSDSRQYNSCGVVLTPDDFAEDPKKWPLTVVWQPEVSRG